MPNINQQELPGLHQAVIDRDLQKLRWLLSTKHEDVDELAAHPNPLSVTIQTGRSIIKWKRGIALAIGTPIHFAAFNRNIDAAEELLSHGADIDKLNLALQTPLSWASCEGQDGMITWLINHGVDINSTNNNYIPPLYWAVDIGHVSTINLLLSKTCNVNYQFQHYKRILLYLAARLGHAKIVQLLLEKGANVNQLLTTGHTALHVAACKGHDKVVQLLLEKGANVNQSLTTGRTALHVSASKGHDKVVQLLLEKGANINQPANDGHIPLHSAVNTGSRKMVQLLLDNGANPQLRTKNGFTAVKFATKPDIVQVLRTYSTNSEVLRELLLASNDNISVRSHDEWSLSCTGASEVTSVITDVSAASIDQSYPMKKISYQDKLRAEFLGLGLDVHCHEDLSSEEITECLHHYGNTDHSHHYCFICCILSHGGEGKIYGVDGNTLTPLEITSRFVAKKCPSLKDKPKVFIFVACKGSEKTEVEPSDAGDNSIMDVDDSDLDIGPGPGSKNNKHRLHEKDFVPLLEEDFVIASSTIPGQSSYRNRMTGSHYDNHLSKNLGKYGSENCITEILRNTGKHLTNSKMIQKGKRMKQVCSFAETLRKRFVLKRLGQGPKYVKKKKNVETHHEVIQI